MWLNFISIVRRTLLIVTLLSIAGVACAQRSTTVNRYIVVDLGEHSGYSDIDDMAISSMSQRYLFALKTNLLFTALSAINIEAEIPIGQKLSLAGEIIFPWWTMDNHQSDSRRNRLQLINANIEAKYWWGERALRPLLTGWFVGVYAGTGTYDVEYHTRGYQGDAFFSVGVSGGYAHAINRTGNLRLEYTLGVGYMTTYYHYYEAEFCDNRYWHAIEMRSGRYKWLGITRAKISLAVLIDYRAKR